MKTSRPLASIAAAGHLALGIMFLFPGTAHAQTEWRVRPSIAAAQVHDSNVFSTTLQRQADFITRLTPQMDVEYRSPLWKLTSRYALDVEHFADRSELSSLGAGQRAATTLEYRPDPRLAIAVGGELWRTHDPRDLASDTGLAFTRSPARRIGAQSSIARQMTPLVKGSVAYAFTEDRADGIETRTHAATVGADRHLSQRNKLTASYDVRHYSFSVSSATSHGLSVGLTRAMTSHTTLSIQGGPNVTSGSAALDVLMTLREQGRYGDLAIAYARRQTTAFGVAGVVQTHSLAATTAWHVGRSVLIRVDPAFYRSEQGALEADVYRLTIGAVHPLASHLSLEVAFDGSVQHGALFSSVVDQAIPRREITIKVVAGSTPAARR